MNILGLFIRLHFYTNPGMHEPFCFLRDLILLKFLLYILSKMYNHVNNKIIIGIILLITMPLHLLHV